MKHARQGAVALLAFAIASAPALADEPADRKPGFFRQLGKSLKDAGQQAIGAKPAASGAAAAGTLYTPVSGAGRINGLFKNENHESAQQGRLDWPRVALTFREWGASLPCWTVEARIWTSATASTTETFRVCAPVSRSLRNPGAVPRQPHVDRRLRSGRQPRQVRPHLS